MLRKMKKKYNNIPEEDRESFSYDEKYKTIIERENDLKKNKLDEDELNYLRIEMIDVINNIEEYLIVIEERKPKFLQSFVIDKKNNEKVKESKCSIEDIKKDCKTVEMVMKCIKNNKRQNDLMKIISKYNDESTVDNKSVDSDAENIKVYIFFDLYIIILGIVEE